jgi:hypothetical protein
MAAAYLKEALQSQYKEPRLGGKVFKEARREIDGVKAFLSEDVNAPPTVKEGYNVTMGAETGVRAPFHPSNSFKPPPGWADAVVDPPSWEGRMIDWVKGHSWVPTDYTFDPKHLKQVSAMTVMGGTGVYSRKHKHAFYLPMLVAGSWGWFEYADPTLTAIGGEVVSGYDEAKRRGKATVAKVDQGIQDLSDNINKVTAGISAAVTSVAASIGGSVGGSAAGIDQAVQSAKGLVHVLFAVAGGYLVISMIRRRPALVAK